MKTFFKRLGSTLGDLFTSKKFLTAAGGVGLAILKGAPPGTAIIAGASTYVLSQGMADFGKVAKQPAGR